ncbi:TcdA/TcdB pore-forming domain-containing protein [Providencia vermicola]|uniref:TcdA/TcdB pore-forming domain-containing protein n=1 Tax=Providencia vermicola TaxID=333965 RepID=UPI0021FC515E|nr:T3SS effector HopA1 family protein [Providencia stuartii]
MREKDYESLLAISREGRDRAIIVQELIDLIKEVKVGYKNNNSKWNDTLRKKRKYIEEKITDIIYQLYSNDIPPKSSRLNLEERKLFLGEFTALLNSEVRDKVSIRVQGQNEEPFFKLSSEQQLNASAYRILPKDYRQRYLNSSNLMARLTVNVNKQNYANLAEALTKLYDNDPQKNVIQSKIMGPKNLGNRTDQAVIYLAEANSVSAKEVSQQLKSLLPPDALIEHTPVGMKRLMTGISYSETVEGQSSSHGESRAVIMAKAVTESLLTGERLKNILPRTLQRFGYDPKDPAIISQTIKDRFLKTGLNSLNLELSTADPSRDIQQFELNPEQFCYSYKVNADYLNDVDEIPADGKVVFYRNEKAEYEIKYVDDTYHSNPAYALESYFLDTNSKDSGKDFSNYIDIEKTSPKNKFLFLSKVNKGSIIVTELDSEKYRVYYDSRYNSSLLYDNVTMAVDEQDYKNGQNNSTFIFLYFDGEDWKLVSQDRSNREGIYFSPNNVKVKSTGSYLLDEKKSDFEIYRNNTHEKLNVFAKKLEVYFFTAERDSIKDENTANATHWLTLANEVKRKLQASSDELKNRIKSIELNLKKINDENIIADMQATIDVNQVLDKIKNEQFNEIYSSLLEVEYAFYLQTLKQNKGMDFVVRGKESGAFASKKDEHSRLTIIERYENLLYLHKTSKNSEFRNEFNEGMKNYNNIVIKEINSKTTSWELKKQYVLAEISAKERGALYRLIQEADYAEYIDKILIETGKISEFFYENGSKINRLIPQGFYLSIIKSGSGGRCYPLVRAMSVALAKGGQNSADKLIDKLYVAAANPDDENSLLLKEGLKNLHSNTEAVESSFSYGKMSLNKIQELLTVRNETMMFALNTSSHSMMLGKKVENGKSNYYFYDPNFGIFVFDDSQSLFNAITKFFTEKKFAPYYSAFEVDGKLAFNLVYIDTHKMRGVSIGNQLTVENLSDENEISTIEARQNKAKLILKGQNEIYQDLQLKCLLSILDANQWAEKIHEASVKLFVENNLDDRWLPLFHNIEEEREGHYRLQLIHLDNPSLTQWVETTDKSFIDFHQYSLEKMMEFGRYYHFIEEEFKQKPQTVEGDSIDGLNAGIAIQSIIQWVEDRNRNENTETSNTSNLAMALKIHTYVNYALITSSTVKDVVHIAQLAKTALSYQTKTVYPSMNLFSSSLAKVANEGLSTFFNGALIGFDIYEITQAENEPQTITFSSQLAFDSASFLTNAATIGADAFGYTTASASLGGMGVIVAGLGIGFTALARNFAIIGEDAKAVGLYFSALDQAYQGNGYEYSKDNKVLVPKFGAVFKTVDLQANQIEFDSQYIYRTSAKSSGGGRKNYIFWAGNFPTMVHDRQQAINIRIGIGYANKYHSVDFLSQENIFLPITPKSYIKYEYNLWPGATTRHDNGFGVIRRLEQADNFDYDFYIFPSENTITHIYHEYVNTPISVKLDSKKRNLIIPNLPKEWHGFVSYNLEGCGGKYTININSGVSLSLSDCSICQSSSQWVINSKEIENEVINIFDDRIRVGDVDIYIESENPESKYYIIKNEGELNEIDFKEKVIKTISIDEEVWKDNIKGFEEYLHTLSQEQKSHQQYVIIENYQQHGNNVGRAYFDVKTEKIIFTHSIEAEKKNALLAGVRNDKAIFYSLESPLIWVVDLNNGNIIFEYRLENKMARNLEILKVWPEENAIYFSCRYQDSFEVANYQIVENNIELVSIVSTPETLVYLASTHTQLEEVELEGILKSYLIDNKNNIATSDLKGSNLANLVMISGNDHHQAQHRYWIRPQDNKLIKPNLSASLGFGHFPVDRTLKQSHWAIPEDLHLVTSLFDSDGTEVFYFYSDTKKSLYRQEGAGQDVLNVIKPSAWFMYKPNLDSVFTWKGNLLLIDSFGVVSQLHANGDSFIVALNDKWFQDHAFWWRDIEFLYQDKTTLALLGIKSVDNEKILPAWSVQGKVIIAHQLSSENELQFLGLNAACSGGVIFDKKQKKLYELEFATEKELMAAFSEGSVLNNPTDLPSIIDLYPGIQINKVERVDEGLLISTENAGVLYADLSNNPSDNKFNVNHLSSSLIIQGGKEHDILSPSIIKNVKNIILSGGEGQDSYLITQEAWLNYQTIIIDNDSYDEKEDILILPALNRQTLMTFRRDADLVIFDINSSTSLVIRQVFGGQSKTHDHLKIRMHNQSYTMSLSEFTQDTIHTEGLFNEQQGDFSAMSEHQTHLIIEKAMMFNFDLNLSQQDTGAYFTSERAVSLIPPLLSPYS